MKRAILLCLLMAGCATENYQQRVWTPAPVNTTTYHPPTYYPPRQTYTPTPYQRTGGPPPGCRTPYQRPDGYWTCADAAR